MSAALVVASCASVTGKSSAPTTTLTNFANPPATRPPTSGGLTSGGGARPRDVAASLGPCPQANPAIVGQHFSLSAVNAAVVGLDTKLVPITAQRVRVCSYNWGGGTLNRTGELQLSAAAQFEASTNRLKTPAQPPRRGVTCHEFDTSFLTFATAMQRMDVAASDCGRGQASNGPLRVELTRTWLNQVERYTRPYAPTMPVGFPCPPGPTGPGAPPGPTAGPFCPASTRGTVVADRQCTLANLFATFGFVNNAQYGLGGLVLTNNAPWPCTLSGSPDVRVVDRRGKDLMVPESHGMAGNTPPPPPKGPITVAANGGQPRGGVPMDWGNWCLPSPGPFTLHVRFAGWATFLVATPTGNADVPPPCTDKTAGTGLGISVVLENDKTGFHDP